MLVMVHNMIFKSDRFQTTKVKTQNCDLKQRDVKLQSNVLNLFKDGFYAFIFFKVLLSLHSFLS